MCYIISYYLYLCLKKGYNMALKIKNREEAIAVLRDMVQRKRKWRNKFKKNLPKYVKKQKIHSLAKGLWLQQVHQTYRGLREFVPHR